MIYITTPAEETVEAATEAEETEETEAETESVAAEEVPSEGSALAGKSWIGLVMIAGVITFLLAGAMIFRSASKKGGRYNR